MNKKGSRVERELVKMFWNSDCAAMRAPASGGATKKPLPDIIAGNGKVYLAIEVKSTSAGYIYINSEKIMGLIEFSEIFGAEPYLGAKFKNKKWRFVHVNDLVRTRGENYKVDVDLAFSKGIEFDELIRKDRQIKFS